MEFSIAFKAAGLAERLGIKIYTLLKSAKSHKRKVLLELQENIDVFYLWKEKDFPIDKVILKLGRKHYDSAVSENFSFNSLKKSGLKESTTKNVPQFQRYVGWSTEKLFDNLYRRIKQLRDIVEMDWDNKKVDKKVRLTNIHKMIILIVHHIKP